MHPDMDDITESDSDIFGTVLADINHIDRLSDDEIEDYSMGACLLLLNHYPFADIRQRWLDNPTDESALWMLHGAIIAASTLDPHLSIDALARLYQLPLDLVTQALTV
ncbi:hypothetical protein [Cutibacterium acnes]|uniref:hypothetical protein n=1 Tax=Cutibacterium acnes TaxID=1747 RepID=UPI0001F08BAF|nr:hypothetical protein [Cutibacterium acnes]EFT01070.1 hypothetical protein HMPREF9609_00277 [Cutibacterium acnes HL027PA1]MBU5161912.1 alkyldihydroxyacetonephosphate synthase [Cutibacterium acnes]